MQAFPAVPIIRPLGPDDAAAFHAFILGLSHGSRLNRFMAPVHDLAPKALRELTEVDQARHVALVALDGGEIVGEARYVRLGSSPRAEFALAVADRWQRRGLGSRLLGELAGTARRAGIALLECDLLRNNGPMQVLVRGAGFRVRSVPGEPGVMRAELPLANKMPRGGHEHGLQGNAAAAGVFA